MTWLVSSFSQSVHRRLDSDLFSCGRHHRCISPVRLRGCAAPGLGWRRDTDRLVKRYTTPLLRATEALERRINILVRNQQKAWYPQDEYFRLSTLFVFGEYLGWVRLLEREFGFVPYESTRRGREFYRRLNGFFARSLVSPTSDGTKTRTRWMPRRSAANAHGDR